MEAHLAESIQDSLNQFLYPNAVFLAERLVASFPNEGNRLLLATCYMRVNQAYRAFATLKGLKSAACRYLFAVACLQLEKFSDAEEALSGSSEEGSTELPGGAAGHHLLGTVYLRTNRARLATSQFSSALAADPFLWSAHQELCALGEGDAAVKLLAEANPAALFPPGDDGFATPASHDVAMGTPSGGATPRQARVTTGRTPRGGEGGDVAMDSPGAPASTSFVTPTGAGGAHHAWPPHPRQQPSTARLSGGGDSGGGGGAGQRRRLAVDEAKLRKVSGRLFSESRLPAGSLRRSSRLASAGAPPADPGTPAPPCGEPRCVSKTAAGCASWLSLVRGFSSACRSLSVHRPADALAALASLPPAQAGSCYALVLAGRAHATGVDYGAAARCFGAARSACPHSLDGMEHFSTVLWQLRRDAELAALAHEALALDRLHPASWMCAGNCLSSQREHEAALRAFSRAIALDKWDAYAHTLAAHEHCAAEDWEAAKKEYRSALGLDARHYNAWYGLGIVCMRQEKYDDADYNFARAVAIHPRSSVLHCCRGQALHLQGKLDSALNTLAAAAALDPRNPLARFERASVYVSQDRLAEALGELSALRDVAPREASVYNLLAKVYRRMGEPGLAALSAGTAADLGGGREAGKEEEETVRENDAAAPPVA